MLPEVRGRWLVDQGVAARWKSAGISDKIKAYWPASKRTRYPALHDEEARPRVPHPYVVYESADPTITGHSTGKANALEQQYEDVAIVFKVHAKSTSARSGRSIAIEIAKCIKEAFDPGTDRLDLTPDNHLCTIADGDYHEREGDEEWLWVIEYTIRLDATYRHTPNEA